MSKECSIKEDNVNGSIICFWWLICMREPTNERTNKKNAFKVFVFAGWAAWVFPFQFCVLRVSKIESNNPPKNMKSIFVDWAISRYEILNFFFSFSKTFNSWKLYFCTTHISFFVSLKSRKYVGLLGGGRIARM